MNIEIYQKIKKIKKEYESDGFYILGIFGSFARGEENTESDIDILYDVSSDFRQKYRGFKYFGRITDIKTEIEKKMKREVDLAFAGGLNKVGKKYILNGVTYV